MAQYTKLLARDIQEIVDQYALDLTHCLPIDGGAANSSYLLSTPQGKFILTICENAPTRVAQMNQVLLLLAQNEFPAPRIHPLANGKLMTFHQGKPVTLKPYITGTVIKNLTNNQLSQIGAAMAQLHEIPAPDYLPDKHMYVDSYYPLIMKTGTDHTYMKWLTQRNEALTKSIPANLPVGLIHGDLFYDNVLFEDGNMKAVLDFEDPCRSYKVFDVGMAVVGLCTDGSEIPLDAIRAFVNGYQSVRLLENAEKDCLKNFVAYTALLTSAWRYWKYNMDVPNKAKANNYLQMVAIAYRAETIPQSAFIEVVFS